MAEENEKKSGKEMQGKGPEVKASEKPEKMESKADDSEASQEPQVDVDTLPLVKRVKEFKDDLLEEVKYSSGEITFLVKREGLLDLCRFLKEDPETEFDFLTEVIGVHYPDRDRPLEVVYHLYSTSKRHRVRLKVQLAEGEEVESVFPVWRSANWYEREVYDMVGIHFANHPDLKRILLPDDWEGHPLRRDYPLEGPAGYRESWLKAHCTNTNKL
jgi:NADH-quinone oxidoreductase subunit C